MTEACLLKDARWIYPADIPYMHNTYAQYRRDFALDRLPAKAPFQITADQSYMLYVNGHYVGRGPARGYQFSWPYDAYDLAPFLRKGHNWISVRHYNGGISTFGYRFEWRAGMRQEIRAKRGRPLHLPDTGRGMRSDEIGAEQTGLKSGESDRFIVGRFHSTAYGESRVNNLFFISVPDG